MAEACDRVIYMRDGLVTHDEAPAGMWGSTVCCSAADEIAEREVAYAR